MIRFLLLFPFFIPALLVAADDDPAAAAEDYGKLRRGFAESETFNPIALQYLERELCDKAMEVWKEGRAAEATEYLYEVLTHYPISMEAHIRLADAFKALLDSGDSGEQTDFYLDLERKHRFISNGLIESVLDTGDGLTPETAFEIITFSEEVWVLRHLRMAGLSRVLDEEKQLVIYETIQQDETRNTIFFDISMIVEGVERLRAREQQEAKEQP